MSQIDVLSVTKLSPLLEPQLRAVFNLHDRLHETDPAAFAKIAPHIRAIAASGESKVPGALIEQLPALEIISVFGVGYDGVDVAAAIEHGIPVTHTPDVLTETTADFGFALLMATARRMAESEHYLRRGEWTQWRYDMFAGAEVHGSTIGILGMGRIGQGIARRAAHGFGMKVIYHNRSRLSAESEAECKATYVSKEELLKTADHVMLVVPYSAASHHTIGAAELAQNQLRLGAAQGMTTQAGVFGNLGTAQQAADIDRLKTTGAFGDLQRGIQQQQMDAEAKYRTEKDLFGKQQIGYMSDVLRGVPSTDTTQTTTTPPPSFASQLAGLGLTGLSLYNTMK